MITVKWSPAEEALCQRLVDTHTAAQISEEINKRYKKATKGFSTPRSANAVSRKCIRESWSTNEGYRQDKVDTTPESTDEQWAMIKDIVHKHKGCSVHNTRGVIAENKLVTKILSLSDIHFPFANETHLKTAIDAHRDATICVVNGDLLEGYTFSTFPKNKSVAALDEYNAAFSFIEMLSGIFPQVILVDGNHDVRAARSVKELGLSKEATQILRPNLMARIANGERLDNQGKLIEKLNFKNVIYQENESWYVRIGKALFIHPHGSGSGGPGGMVRKHSTRFNCRYSHDEIDAVICGHTHQIYKSVINNQLLIDMLPYPDVDDVSIADLAKFVEEIHTPKRTVE